MENVFLKQFLMISDVRTIAFLAVLAALFYLIHVLYHKKHMDFAAVVMIGTGLSGVGMGAQFGMVSPILAIDPIIDMARTMINVTGSLTNALVVDKLMGNLNMDAYNDMSERIVGARSAEQSGINAKTKKENAE